MQGHLSSAARGSVSCKGICHQSVGEVNDSCKRFCLHSMQGTYPLIGSRKRRNLDLTQVVLSHARGSGIRVGEVMQEVLSSDARGSVIWCKSICLMQEDLSCKWFHIQTVTVRSCHARGSVTQEYLSCKWFCLWSSSNLGFMQVVLSLNKVLLTQ